MGDRITWGWGERREEQTRYVTKAKENSIRVVCVRATEATRKRARPAGQREKREQDNKEFFKNGRGREAGDELAV